MNGAVFGEILSQTEAKALMANPKFKKVATGISNNHMKALEEVVNEHQVLQIMDKNGVPHSAYNKLVQIMKSGVRQLDKNLNFTTLPNAYRVSISKQCSEQYPASILFLHCAILVKEFAVSSLCDDVARILNPTIFCMTRWVFSE